MQVSNLSVDQLKDVIVGVLKEMNVATKDDLKGFATKDDLKGFATKDDLKTLEVKIDKLATKVELKKIDKKLDKMFDFLDKDYIRVKQDVREIQSHLHIPMSDF